MRIILLLIALGLAGCSGPRPIPIPKAPFLPADPKSVIDSVQAHILPRSFRADAVLSMKTSLYSGTLNAEIFHRRADSLLMIFRVPGLGFEGGRLLVTPDSFFFYNRLTQTLHMADSNHPALPDFFTVENALEKLLGFVRPVYRSDMKLLPTKDGLVLEDFSNHMTYTIAPEFWRVIHVVEQNSSEALYMDDFFAVGEAYFPRKVIYRNPVMNTSAILIYKSIVVNETITSMSLDLPPGIQSTPLSVE